jgi:hypothetical protein
VIIMAKVPTGVAILAVLNMLVGILIILGTYSLLSGYGHLFVGPWMMNIEGMSLLIGLFYVFLGIGLFSLATWAWWVDIFFAILNLLIALLSYPQLSWLTIIINLVIVVYLNQSGIKRKFKV